MAAVDPGAPSSVNAEPSAALALGRTIVPPGVRVMWSQRHDKVVVTVDLPDVEAPCVSFADSGLVSLDATSTRSGEALAVRLQCMHRIDAAQCRCAHAARHFKQQPVAPRVCLMRPCRSSQVDGHRPQRSAGAPEAGHCAMGPTDRGRAASEHHHRLVAVDG